MKNNLFKIKSLTTLLVLSLSSPAFAAQTSLAESEECSDRLKLCENDVKWHVKQLKICQEELGKPITTPKELNKKNDCSKDFSACDLLRRNLKTEYYECNKQRPKPVAECPTCPTCPATSTDGSGNEKGGKGSKGSKADKGNKGATSGKNDVVGTCGPNGNDSQCKVKPTEKGNTALQDLMVKKKDQRQAAGNNHMYEGKQYNVKDHARLQKEVNKLECKLGYAMSRTTPKPENAATEWGRSEACN